MTRNAPYALALAHARSPDPMPKDARFFARLAGRAKPFVFPDIAALARHIHRRRDGRPIELLDTELQFRGEPAARPGVSVFAYADEARSEHLAWCYLDGADRRALQAALADAQPEALAA